jgi:hypothetical protein
MNTHARKTAMSSKAEATVADFASARARRDGRSPAEETELRETIDLARGIRNGLLLSLPIWAVAALLIRTL